MDKVNEKFKYYNSQADKELSKYQQIVKLEQATGVPKTYLVAGVISFVSILIFFNVWGDLFSDLVGWVYPAYASFKAIESPNKADDTQWLTYWAVFGFVNIVEFFSDLILYWIPFYYFLKTLFFLWLFLPTFHGAETLYQKFLRQTLLSYQGEIDKGLNKVKSKTIHVVKEVKEAINTETEHNDDKTE
jgi:receptor expression-enhancing protein 5/6